MIKLWSEWPQVAPEDCPNRVREYRLARGISQVKLGRLTGIHPGDIASIERGRKPLTTNRRARLSAALEVQESELFREEGKDDNV